PAELRRVLVVGDDPDHGLVDPTCFGLRGAELVREHAGEVVQSHGFEDYYGSGGAELPRNGSTPSTIVAGAFAGAAPVALAFTPAVSLATSPSARPSPFQSAGIWSVNRSRMYSPSRQRSLGKNPFAVACIELRTICGGVASVGTKCAASTGHA